MILYSFLILATVGVAPTNYFRLCFSKLHLVLIRRRLYACLLHLEWIEQLDNFSVELIPFGAILVLELGCKLYKF